MTKMPLEATEMNADKSYSSISMAQKREKLMALVGRKKSGKRPVPQECDNTMKNIKKSEKESAKTKKLNSHFYKKLFQVRRKKMNVSNVTLAKESCSGPTCKKQRLCWGRGGGESVHQSGTKDKIESGRSELADIQFEVSTEIHNHILPYVNKLHDHRNRGQNAVFLDGLDRLAKVVSFVLSLLDDIKKPILIIASTSALSLWGIEFSKWSKSVNAVTYKGTKDIRTAIRGSKFQVLLSSPENIVEDMKMLNHIKWELLVIDECQRPVISMHLKKFQMLMADMKVVTVSGEPADILQSYRNILSLVDCKNEKIHADADMEMNDDISTFKERLSPFVAFECKFTTLDLQEYWVPVHLSSMQIEQYCSILVSNSVSLSSLSKTTSLNDVITQIQKCCDHPYLVDPTLRNSSKEASLTDPLAAEVNISGKLHVFYKLLLEIKRCGLRALVLFHSSANSEKISTGHFLDDLVHQRFGENSYVYIPGQILSNSASVMKKEALEMFNKADSDRFICLCDHRACLSSLRLSRVDVVILFNSDPNPLNDVKALKRITIDSHCERLNVFRLYSVFSGEEKALILSKQGTPVDSYISWSVRHQLLAWGTTYLFSKLKSCTESEPLFRIDDLVRELSSLLTNTRVETDHAIVSDARMQDGAYSGSVLLFGETEMETHMKEKGSSIDEFLNDNRHSVFWSNLVKQSQPVLENSCSRLPRRVQKSPRYWFEGIDANTPSFVRSKPRSKRKLLKNVVRKRAGRHTPFGTRQARVNATEGCPTISDSIASSPRTNGGQQSQTERTPPATSTSTPLETEIERIQKERENITKSHQEEKSMLLSELEKVISEAQKKYDALVHDSETKLADELKILEDYEKLVSANKLLAEILAQNWQDALNPNQTKLNRKRKQKDTSAFSILQIPASALVRPKNPCLTRGPTTYFPGHSLAGPGLRSPAPHLRSSPSMFASLRNRPATGEPSLDPLPSLNYPNS